MLAIDSISVHLPGFSLKAVSFSVGPSDIFALLGPTGSGKSVLLEAVAGLLHIQSGRVSLRERDITKLPPESRNLGLVYQDHALFPHMSVQENILYGARYHKISETVRRNRFERLTQRLRLESILRRNPLTLSGGEKQRTALARALMLNPQALLLDEPLSALDQVFRDDIRQMLKGLQRELAIPFILVSHSFSEVLLLANKGAVIRNGRLQQSGTVEDLFERPRSAFVASFVGMKNVFPCTIAGDDIQAGGITLRKQEAPAKGHTHVAVRPEEIELLSRDSSGGENVLQGTIKELDCQGFYYLAAVQIGSLVLQAYWTRQLVRQANLRPGQNVAIEIPARAVHTFAEPA